MDNIFGLPMAGTMLVLLIILVLCLTRVAWIAWRRPVIFKLGTRNIPRRKAQTTLIVVGLMLSTLIISAALGTGDTLHHSLTADSYKNLGGVDQLVVASSEYEVPNFDTSTPVDDSTLAVVDDALAGNSDVDGVMPVLEARVSATNETTRQSEPSLVLFGADPARFEGFGQLRALDGSTIDLAAIGADGVVLSEHAADDLSASVGDSVTVFYEYEPHQVMVAAIAENSYLSGFRRGREDLLEYGGMVMLLPAVQELTGQEGLLSAVAISGAGDLRNGYKLSDDISDALRPTLEGTGLGVDAIKRYAVDAGEKTAGTFTAIFLVLGLFSIMAGLLLIVLIFTMLAAERRSEMGMARAVGTQRKQLIQQFISEGAGYALLAGLVGSAMGVGAAIGIAKAMKWLFGEFVPIEPHVEPRSMVVAYCLGVTITFLTIMVSSWKISRLNVVSAIRDIPDVSSASHRLRSFVWGIVLFAGGGFLAMSGLSGETAAPFYLGMSLVPFGLALILRAFRAPSRPTFSLMGLAILVLWLIPERVANNIWGELDGDIELFFLSGTFMVIGATILTMQNTDILLSGVNKLGGLFKGALPAVRTAVAYPSAARGRTGMTIAMFSLIVFSLVMIATMNSNYSALNNGDDANAGWEVRADSRNGAQILDFDAALADAGVDTSGIDATAVTTNPNTGSSSLRLAGEDEWKLWSVIGMDNDFIEQSALSFQARADGYETDADIVAALGTQPNVAVIDSFAIPAGGFGGGGAEDAFSVTGVTLDDTTFEPISVEMASPDGSVHDVTIIGIIDEKVSSLSGLYANQTTIDAVYPDLTTVSYHVSVTDPDTADATAKAIESALFSSGVEGYSIEDELKDAQQQESGFTHLIEGFMGLGLVVGVAAVGVIAFRSVVERRQQIGVLRALGFQRGLVSLGFLIETGFVVGTGAITGTVLGVILSYNLFTSESAGAKSASFTAPWGMISIILTATLAAALLMTWLPSRQAARIAPAEALRYE